MWDFVWADKAQSALSAQTKFHIQKCDTCRSIFLIAKSHNFILTNGTAASMLIRIPKHAVKEVAACWPHRHRSDSRRCLTAAGRAGPGGRDTSLVTVRSRPWDEHAGGLHTRQPALDPMYMALHALRSTY